MAHAQDGVGSAASAGAAAVGAGTGVALRGGRWPSTQLQGRWWAAVCHGVAAIESSLTRCTAVGAVWERGHMDAALKEITQYGSERLSKLSVTQRRSVSEGLGKLADETAKTLRTHTIQALNPRANPRDTITALLEEMKKFLAGVTEHVTEGCLDEWDKGIAGYNKDLPIKGKIILQAWAEGVVAEQAKKRERSEKELQKKLERIRHSSQTDLDAKTQQIRVAVQQEQETVVSRLETQVAEKETTIAVAVARAESSEELVESLRTKLVDRTRILEETIEHIKQNARIQERNFEMHMKRKDAEVAQLKAENDELYRRKQGIARDPSPAPAISPISPNPDLQPELESEPDTPTRSLEAAREMAAVTRKLQTAMDNVARITQERDMLLTMMSDRKDRSTSVASIMEELSATKQELSEVKAERDLLLDVVQQQHTSVKQQAKSAAEAGGDLPVELASETGGQLPEEPAAELGEKLPVEQAAEPGGKLAVSVNNTAATVQREGTSVVALAAPAAETAAAEGPHYDSSGEGEELVRNIEELVHKDRRRRPELEALRTKAAVPASTMAGRISQRREAAMAARGGICLPFGHEPQQSTGPSERDWASYMQREEGASGKAGLLRRRPLSAPPSSQRAASTSRGMGMGASLALDDPNTTVSVINLNEEMASEQAARGAVFGTSAPASTMPHGNVDSFLEASASSIGSVTSEWLMMGPSSHRLAAGIPPHPRSAGNSRRKSVGSRLQNRKRPPERRSRGASRRQQRPGSGRDNDILQTHTSGVSALEHRLARG